MNKRFLFLFVSYCILCAISQATIDLRTPGLMKLYTSTPNLGLVISMNGNVGIGTMAPTSLLTVFQNGSNAVQIVGNSSNSIGLMVNNSATGAKSWSIVSSGGGPSPAGCLVFYDNTAGPRMVITTSGNVGIGTTSPGIKTEINGADGLPATSGSAQNGSLRLRGSTGDNSLDLGMSNTDSKGWIQAVNRANLSAGYNLSLLLNPNGGNVGVGTTAPQATLHISSNVVGTPIMKVGSATAPNALVVSTNGNVGIGTTNPLTKLHVSGGSIGLDSNTGIGYYASNGDGVVLKGDGTNTVLKAFATGGGIVFNKGDQSAELMRITSGGNVGIGTTAPGAKLDVNGDIKSAGCIRAQASTQITSTQWFNCGSSCSGEVILHTPIVHNEGNMFMIKIRGYGYGTGGRNKEIVCSGYAYNGSTLISEGCDTIVGATTATITTVARNGATYVAIVLTNGAGYYNHYTWEYIGWQAKDPADFYWEP